MKTKKKRSSRRLEKHEISEQIASTIHPAETRLIEADASTTPRTSFDDFFDEQMTNPAQAELYQQARQKLKTKDVETEIADTMKTFSPSLTPQKLRRDTRAQVLLPTNLKNQARQYAQKQTISLNDLIVRLLEHVTKDKDDDNNNERLIPSCRFLTSLPPSLKLRAAARAAAERRSLNDLVVEALSRLVDGERKT